ncbi:endolytic transglycosylase MltG [Acidobacteriia bacterium AH_259_A11_L15]|nr:endolytic transglycosylase MltG [Acidobacteriia bacterium AH_259_A11_L15]
MRLPALSRRVKLLAALAGVVVLVAALLLWPYKGYEGQRVLVVDQGMGRRAIAGLLTREGVLYSRWPFLFYAALRANRTVKAGEYVFDQPLSAVGVFRKLARGEIRLYALTIPEGYTRWDIADQVARLRLASREAFLEATNDTKLLADLAPEAETLEGYLFPDTYYFARPAEPRAMVRTMVERFRRVYLPLKEEAANPQGLSPHEVVTLASLVEKETGVAEERGLIASVFYNRLERRIALQADPTVIYAARLEGEGEFDRVINVSDLERDHPYNTYKHPGLPPGPIASPGKAALEAVLNPPETRYLYFVSNTEGGHFFARTGAEHARNVARYRRLRAEKRRRARTAESSPE